jgi:hypothetical protein
MMLGVRPVCLPHLATSPAAPPIAVRRISETHKLEFSRRLADHPGGLFRFSVADLRPDARGHE